LLLRLLFFFLVAYILVSLLKAYIRKRHLGPRTGRESRMGKEEEMVLDPQCRAYVPKSAALLDKGNYFCSQECARLYLSR
jgi:hypothetical protein